MLPSELGQSMNTPTFQGGNAPAPQGKIYQPNEPKFYDGSITQILGNPAINPDLKNNLAENYPPAYPPPQPGVSVQSQPSSSNYQGPGGEVKPEEIKEEIIDTTHKVESAHSAPAPKSQQQQGKLFEVFPFPNIYPSRVIQ